ncbi:MAG: SDR family NAD(P)-dependent oxidoreductase [Gammaproteobacteria bacterium]|nr:SDR family NAD(P)-dependent oxidoreductase [Gammaproteobacteria bacterium]
MTRTVVITGASAGIGRALAFECARRGWRLGLASRRRDALETLRGELDAVTAGHAPPATVAELDVADPAGAVPRLQALFEALGGVDVFIANAGVNEFTRIGKGGFPGSQRILQTNLIGTLATMEAAAAHFVARGHGHLVGISSLAALMSIPTQGAYCASKAGLSSWLGAARIELGRQGIAVTEVQPGFVDTEIMPDVGRYPFAIKADAAARTIVDGIERRRRLVVVPGFPWRLLRPFARMIPDSAWRRRR